jgi:c-di-GMP-binding flagellar brake protein YcgR
MVIERIQRRKWPRLRIDLPATLCPVTDATSLQGVPGRTVDVSVGGACVETLRALEGEGDPMLMLSLPDGGTIVCATATIAVEELEDGWRYRLAFIDLDGEESSRLQTLTASGVRTES